MDGQPTTSVQPARLMIEGDSEPIFCWFNPKEYGISKSNNWEVKPVPGRPLPKVQFGGGQARELNLDLLFDASDSPSANVIGVCNRLFKVMEVDQKLGSGGQQKNNARPPKVTFTWGRVLTFQAVLRQLSVQFTLFRADGAPIRAQAKLALVQVEESLTLGGSSSGDKRQNPTTTGLAGRRSHIVRDGDTLASIAHRAYSDPTRWRVIAEANGIDDPVRIRRGTVLTIPTEGD